MLKPLLEASSRLSKSSLYLGIEFPWEISDEKFIAYIIIWSQRWNLQMWLYSTLSVSRASPDALGHVTLPMLGRLVSYSIYRTLPIAQRSILRRNMSVFSSSRLENKTVLITGASGGIGEVIGILLSYDPINLMYFKRRPRFYLPRSVELVYVWYYELSS